MLCGLCDSLPAIADFPFNKPFFVTEQYNGIDNDHWYGLLVIGSLQEAACSHSVTVICKLTVGCSRHLSLITFVRIFSLDQVVPVQRSQKDPERLAVTSATAGSSTQFTASQSTPSDHDSEHRNSRSVDTSDSGRIAE